jgi:YD repeat-containing protein
MQRITSQGLRAMASLTLLLALTACGGGGDGEADGGEGGDGNPPPPAGTADTTRLSIISLDMDNNGTPDATDTLTYDAAGRVVESRYVYSGDGTTDLFVGEGTQSRTTTYSYDADGRVSSVTAADTSFTFTFGNTGLPLRADVSTMGIDGRIDFTHDAAGLMIRAVTTVAGSAFGTDTFQYDAAGRRTLERETAPGDTSGVQTVYTWNEDGTLAAVARDVDADGLNVRYEMTYADGRQTGTRKSVGGAVRYTVNFEYDASGRPTRTHFDVGGDGGVDAVWTLTWQAGACRAVTLPVFDPLLDSITGYGSNSTGKLANCAAG